MAISICHSGHVLVPIYGYDCCHYYWPVWPLLLQVYGPYHCQYGPLGVALLLPWVAQHYCHACHRLVALIICHVWPLAFAMLASISAHLRLFSVCHLLFASMGPYYCKLMALIIGSMAH